MKYTILGFQQSKLLSSNLDLIDALILRVLLDRYATAKMESIIEDDNRMIWVYWGSILEDIPIAVKTRSSLEKRVKKYCDEGYLVRIRKNKKNGKGGNYVYVKPTEKLDSLSEYEQCSKNCGTYAQNFEQGIRKKLSNKDSSFNDPSFNDSKTHCSSDDERQFDSKFEWFFNKVYEIYPRKVGKTKGREKLKKICKEGKIKSGKDSYNVNSKEIAGAIKIYADECDEKETEDRYIKMFDAFVNGRLLDYIFKYREEQEDGQQGM